VVDFSEEEFEEILAESLEDFPDMKESLGDLEELGGEAFIRFMGIDTSKEHLRGFTFPFLFSFFAEDDIISALPLDFMLEMSVQALPDQVPEAEVLDSKISETAAGVEVGIIDVIITDPEESGYGSEIFVKQAIFKVEKRMVMMVFYVVSELREDVEPVFDEIIDSIDYYSLGDI
jgi:hypothetical protein